MVPAGVRRAVADDRICSRSGWRGTPSSVCYDETS